MEGKEGTTAKAVRVLRYARQYWHRVLWLFCLSLILVILALVGPYLVKILIDDVLVNKNLTLLVALMLIFVGIFFVKSLIQIYYNYQTEALEERIVLDVKTQLYGHLEMLDLGFFYSRKLGDILTRMDDDVYGIQNFINILMNVLTAVAILIVCLHLNWRVTLASLTFFPFYIVAQRYFSGRIKHQKEKVIRRGAALLSFLEEGFTAIKAIKTFLLEQLELRRYTSQSKQLIREDLRLNLLSSYSSTIVGFITFTPLLIILWYGSFKVITGALTVGSLMALYTYIGKLFGPISALGSINVAIQSALVSVDRVFEFLDLRPKVQQIPNALNPDHVRGAIRFENVSFRYGTEEVLHGVGLSLAPGEHVGIVGPSGSGKSTLVNLLCRFYDPSDGRILLDNRDLRSYNIAALRKQLGVISQDVILFNATVAENIRLGNLHAGEQDIVRAAKLSGLHATVQQFPKKYHMMIGERGVNLSGGEAQRLAIARVILKNPTVLIIDEATSALDAESEAKVQKAFAAISAGKTTITIAHRLSTLKQVDRILVLSQGKLVEEGTFNELIKHKGIFSRYYALQFRAPKSDVLKHPVEVPGKLAVAA